MIGAVHILYTDEIRYIEDCLQKSYKEVHCICLPSKVNLRSMVYVFFSLIVGAKLCSIRMRI